MAASTIAREQAEHFCPWYPNADHNTPFTALSTSVSRSTTIASLPPISAITRLIQSCPLRGLAASSLMRSPTSLDPVNAMKRVSGCSTMTSPTTEPLPTSIENDCGGNPASNRTSANLAAMVGVSLDGLITTVLPDTSAAAVIPTMMASGKFQGGTITPTPNGR